MDETLRAQGKLLFHPLANTSTVSISGSDLERFVASIGHAVEYVHMPVRTQEAQP